MATKTASPRKSHSLAEQPFWEHYSPHHEFPLSSVASFSLHALIVGLMILISWAIIKFGLDNNTKPLPVDAVELPGGGGGNPAGVGSGPGIGATGGSDAIPETQPEEGRVASNEPRREALVIARRDALKLDEYKDPDTQRLIDDGGQGVDANLRLSAGVRSKLREGLAPGKGQGGPGRGGGQGSGVGTGKGDGVGPGTGRGNIRTKRVLRWTMIFNTRDGQDYARQLAGLGALLAIPDPAAPDRYLVIRDLVGRPVHPQAEDLSTIKRIYWIDDKPSSVQSLSTALGLQPVPPHVVAFFPEELEQNLLRIELKFRNRKEEEILETRFEIRGYSGRYEPVVVSQRP
jgi:hypothetical protein